MRRIAIGLCIMLVAGPVSAAGAAGAGCGSCAACAAQARAPRNVDAAPCAVADGALKKLGRGSANICTFPVEIYNQMAKTHDASGPAAAFTWGLAKGIAMMGVRVVVGVYEVATFPFPLPAGYRPILTDPEFFFKDEVF